MGGTQRRDQRNQTPKEGKTKDGTSSSSALARHPYLMSSGAILLIVCNVAVMIWWWHARQYEATDDAFIDARIVPISSQVAGAVIDVPVTANQLAGPGALLVQIDPRDDQKARRTRSFRAGVQSAPAEGRFWPSMYWRRIVIGAPPTDPTK